MSTWTDVFRRLVAEVMEPHIASLSEATGAELRLIPVENTLFGPTVTTAGLLPGADVRGAIAASAGLDTVLIPAEALNDDDLFIDSVPFADVADAASPRVVPAYELSRAFARL